MRVRQDEKFEQLAVAFVDRDAQLQQLAERQSAMLDALPAAVLLLDKDANIIAANSQWNRHAAQSGNGQERWEGLNFFDICPLREEPELVVQAKNAIGEVLRGKRDKFSLEHQCRLADRSAWFDMVVTPLRQDEASGAVVMAIDVTERKLAEDALRHMAHHDPLTGLPNRGQLQERVQRMLVDAARDGTGLAVLMLDVDDFKAINDSCGHLMGDTVLMFAAERLASCVRHNDVLGRFGDDEFTLLLPGIEAEKDVEIVGQKVLEALAQPLHFNEKEFFVSVSIGASIYPRDGDSAESLLRNADAAMHQAKADGKHAIRFYTEALNATLAERLQLETDLRHALERQELILHYQPQIELDSGRMVGAEALIRWHHPVRGEIPPSQFMPLVEGSDLIDDIGAWVLRSACTQNKAWQASGHRPIRVAVNVSPQQFRRRHLTAAVTEALRVSGLEAKYLDLEITESAIIHDIGSSVATLHELKALGVQLSVDDFGTGYSSLTSLRRFPINTIKIDGSFVRDLTHDPDDAAIVDAIIAMARSLRLKVIAECVETDEQMAFLARHHCQEIQGFLFSRPVPPDDLAKLLGRDVRLDLASLQESVSQRTLLLVDDEPNVRSAIMRVLRGSGYRILTADNGKAALELLAKQEVGVILSDQRMPEMTGVDFLRRVKDLHPRTIRIVLSGYTELQSVTDAINEGAIYKFLTKPWEDDFLRANIQEAFERYDIALENERLHAQLESAHDALALQNTELESRVRESTQEILHKLNLLQISQEILENLPVAVIGVDEDGLIVVVNRKANELLVDHRLGTLLGSDAVERLPAALIDCLGSHADNVAKTVPLRLPDGRTAEAWCHSMGSTCRSKGVLIVIASKEEESHVSEGN